MGGWVVKSAGTQLTKRRAADGCKTMRQKLFDSPSDHTVHPRSVLLKSFTSSTSTSCLYHHHQRNLPAATAAV